MNHRWVTFFFSLSTSAFAALGDPITLEDPKIEAFLNRNDLRCPRDVNEWKLKQAITHPDILTRMSAPAEKKSWDFYQKLFLTPKRIEGGRKLLHETSVQKASKDYGVPSSIIVAIMGVETLYGEHLGRHRVLDALSTLAFYYPRRESFFQAELACYLNQNCKKKSEHLELKGSYAGAFGIPQFMPCSYDRYAVASNPNSPPDLVHTFADAARSIGHYLKKKGRWTPHQTVVRPITPAELKKIPKDMRPMERPEALNTALSHKWAAPKEAKKIWCPDRCYWLFPNFDSIMTYNISHNYALAVALLAEAIQS